MLALTVPTASREQLVDMTAEVNRALASLGAGDGLCHLWCPHTTAALAVNEGADPDVASDVLSALRRIVPPGGYRHAEGNSPAHVKSVLAGPFLLLPVRAGRLALGPWQSVFLCEFDGPRNRRVEIRFIPLEGA